MQHLILSLICLTLFANACAERQDSPQSEDNSISDISSSSSAATDPLPLESVNTKSPLGDISINYVGSIGAEDKDGYVFSIIKGIVVDRKTKNIFVLDSQMMNLRIFSQDGDLIEQHELVRGQGPGEFQWPMGLALSGDGSQIFIFDQGRRNISVFSKKLEYLRSFEAPTNYAYMAGGPGNTIYASYNQMDINDRPLLYQFDSNGKNILSFGTRHEDFLVNRKKDLQFFYLTFIDALDDKLFLSHAYPYDLHTYDKTGKLIQRVKNDHSFFDGTHQKGEFTFPTGVCFSFIAVDESLLIQFLQNTKEETTYLEALDHQGRSRGLLDMKDERWGGILYTFPDAIAEGNIIYVVAEKPYPRIVIFKVVTNS